VRNSLLTLSEYALADWTRYRLDFELNRLDKREDGGEIQTYLQEKTGQRTVPNIFVSA
jgi:glutaredoxin